MNSLEELNGYNTTFTITYNDLRPAGVTFNKDEPTNQIYQFTGSGLHLISPGIEITSISNYALANVRFRIKSEGSMPSGISWTSIPAHITMDTSVVNQVTLSGLRSVSDWEQVREFYWNLPSNFESYEIWNLRCEIIYYDQESNQEKTVYWLVYDVDHFYVAALPTISTMVCITSSTKVLLPSLNMLSESTFYCEPRIAKLVSTSTLHCSYIRYRDGEVEMPCDSTIDATVFALEFINSSYRFTVGYNVPNQLFLDNTMYVSSELPSETLYNLSWTVTTVGSNVHFASIDNPYVDISQSVSGYTLTQINTFLQKLVLRMTLPNKVTNTDYQMSFVVTCPTYGVSANTTFSLSHRYCIVNSIAHLESGSVIGCPPKPPTTASATLISEFDTFCVVKLPSWSVKYRVTGSSATYRTLNIWVTMPTDVAALNWGDGTTTTITAGTAMKYSHTYTTTGTKTVSITDDTRITNITISSSSGSSTTSYPQLVEVISWGSWIDIADISSRFKVTNSAELTVVPNWMPPYHSSGTFITGCSKLNDPNISNWRTHKVTDMSSFFSGCSAFNQPLTKWNTSAVAGNMNYMFNNCTSFNQSVAHFDMSTVQSIYSMFAGCSAFNQPLGSWNTSNISNMNNLFYNASSFNQDINSWDVGNVTNMSSMFKSAGLFNKSINNWDVRNVTNMSSMFLTASSFNQPLNNWNTHKVTDMSSMFSGASSFDQDINMWDVHLITVAPASFDSGTLASWTSNEKPIWGSTGTACYMSCSTTFDMNLSINLKVKSSIKAQPTLPSLSFKVQSYGSYNEYVVMELYGSGTVNINWGDGISANYTATPTGNHIEKAYTTAGTYTISTTNDDVITRMAIISPGDNVPQSPHAVYITEIISWGSRTDVVQFYPGNHYLISKVPKWRPPALTNATYFLNNLFTLNDPNISYWNMNGITNAEGFFNGCTQFNQPLNNWDTSTITNMDSMFNNCSNFDQNISSWDVHTITSKPYAFDGGTTNVNWTTAEKPRWGTAGSH